MAGVGQLVALGLTGALLLALLRPVRPELAVALSIAASAAIFWLVLPQILTVVRMVDGLGLRAGVAPPFLATVLRVLGIAYLSEFAAGLCRDAGESALAQRVEMGGKVLILVLAIPILSAVMTLILRLLP
jgi:stage III sporulation protein AD